MASTDGSFRFTLALVATAAIILSSGCVRRTLVIDSEPAGALVWLNDREVGRTPVELEFQHYGTYDVRLSLEGYEPRSTFGDASAPWWDIVGPDLVAELLPAQLESRIVWHYDLEPLDRSRDALIDRARALREKTLETPTDGSADPDEADGPETAEVSAEVASGPSEAERAAPTPESR